MFSLVASDVLSSVLMLPKMQNVKICREMQPELLQIHTIEKSDYTL